MSRWASKCSTDDYHAISTKFFKKHRYFESAGLRSGIVSWSRGGEVLSRVGIEVKTYTIHGEIRFQYTSMNRLSGGNIKHDYAVRLVSTPCNYGGIRWWFLCPLVKKGILCQKRVGVLYLVTSHFGCRHCYKLNYQSSKDSHKFDRMFWSMGINPKIGAKKFKESCR